MYAFIDYIVLLVAGLPSFFWFTHGIWIYGDFLIPLNPSISKFIQNFGYTWNCVVIDLGGPYLWLPRFPYYGFFVLMNEFGLNLSISERFYFYFTYTLPGLTMYYLARTLFDKDPISVQRFIAITSGLIYMYNPFLFVTFANLPYGLAPFLLGLLIKGIKNSDNLRYIIGFSIVATLTNVYFPTAGMLVLSIILIVAFTIYLFISKEVQLFSVFLFFISSSTLLFLLNAWWILPYFEQSNVFFEQLIATPIPWFVYRNAILRELLRWLGWWPYYTEYYPYTYVYKDNFFFVILSTLPIIFASCSIFLRYKKTEVTFLLSLITLGLFMAKGPNPPFGEITANLLVNIPLMKFLRETPKFMLIVTIAMSLLIGITFSELYFRMREHIKWKYNSFLSLLGLIFLLLLIMIDAFPVISGKMLFRVNDPLNVSITIPKEYWIVSKIIKDNDNDSYATLYFPPIPAYVQYKWGHAGANILPEIFESPLIYGQQSAYTSNSYLKEVISNPEYYIRLLSLINVKYIIIDRSVSSINDSYVNFVTKSLTSNPDVCLMNNFSHLLLFKIKSPLQRIYMAKSILLSSDPKSAELVINSLNLTLPVIFDMREAIHLPENLFNIPIYIVINVSDPTYRFFSQEEFKKFYVISPISSTFSVCSIGSNGVINVGNFYLFRGNNSIYISGGSIKDNHLIVFKSINQHYSNYSMDLLIKFASPTEYVLRMNASSTYNTFLVFSNSYDSSWAISSEANLSVFQHYRTSLGTNAWAISVAPRETIVKIYYRPQYKLYLGLFIGLVGTPIFLACYLFLNKSKKK
jgi:hypothetical protein